MDSRVRLPNSVRELRVLGIQRLLDLVEHALLVFRERHGASLLQSPVGVTGTDEQSLGQWYAQNTVH
ncbi:hypothetical protein GCM10007079_33730 [Nocardiopsis terrae]|nr:hypothetical protein GCM10007079_33730 [Nocardiopsis terrae]